MRCPDKSPARRYNGGSGRSESCARSATPVKTGARFQRVEHLAFLSDLGTYYGLDYLASATAIGGMYLVGNRSRLGLVLYAVSSLAMILFAMLASSPPILIANAIVLALTVRALWRWSSAQP